MFGPMQTAPCSQFLIKCESWRLLIHCYLLALSCLSQYSGQWERMQRYI